MIKDILINIKVSKDSMELRKNLIELKAELKEEKNKYALLYQLDNDFSTFEKLLCHEDAKVRKHTAFIIGQLGQKKFSELLYEAYQKEQQLFVKSAYLLALRELDYQSLLPDLKKRLEEVKNIIPEENNKKHLDEERKCLTELVLAIDGIKKHIFCGWELPSKLVLLTNRNYPELTKEELPTYKPRVFNSGVMVTVNHLQDVMCIRMVHELLFQLDDLTVCENEPIKAAAALANSSLLSFLQKRHKGEYPFYFRIELKSKMELSKKSAFSKKMAGELERLTKQKLINSTSHYEAEIRLIENKLGAFNLLIKLYTLPDERFSYRKNAVAASIQPVNAALVMALAKNYMKEKAQVLDPFCGVGTMLIERHKMKKSGDLYGLDIYAKAIAIARENTELAGMLVHYINRDFFDFKHEYLFDEIITNMPAVHGHKSDEEIFSLYQHFFKKAKEHLKADGVIIMYSHNRDFVYQCIKGKKEKSFVSSENYRSDCGCQYKLIEEFEISKKEGSYLFVFKIRGH